MKVQDLWNIRPQANPAAVLRGEGYRITVLTDRLLRLEYEAGHHFRDSASYLAICRDFPVPPFSVRRERGFLTVEP